MAKRKRKTHKPAATATTQPLYRQSWLWGAVIVIVVLLGAGIGLANRPMAAPTAEVSAVAAQPLPAEISVDEAYQKYEAGTFVLDVRQPEEWDDFHAPNTTLIPLGELADRVDELPHDQEIVVICRSGNRSQQGRDILLEAGFAQVTSVQGGLNAWREAGYPVE